MSDNTYRCSTKERYRFVMKRMNKQPNLNIGEVEMLGVIDAFAAGMVYGGLQSNPYDCLDEAQIRRAKRDIDTLTFVNTTKAA